MGATDKERALVDMMAEESMDFRNGAVRLFYSPEFESKKPAYVEDYLPARLKQFSTFLGTKEPTFILTR